MCLRLSLADLCNNSSSMAETTDGWTDGGAIIELRRWTEIVNVHFRRDPYTPKGDSNSKQATILCCLAACFIAPSLSLAQGPRYVWCKGVGVLLHH